MNNREEKNKLWKTYSILMGVMLGGSALVLGGQAAWNRIQQHLATSAIKSEPPSTEYSDSAPSSPSANIYPESPSNANQYVSTPNPFDNVGFPLQNCGDSMPTDPTEYPVIFYPVLINYTDKNLQIIKTNFCGDAYKYFKKNKSKYYIQVASFTDLERAENFKNFMLNKIGSGEIGEPRQVEGRE